LFPDHRYSRSRYPEEGFLIHKDIIIFYSEYFRGAFNGNFSEAVERKISLADERVDVFSIVNQFIYTRQLSGGVDSHLDAEVLIRAWIFGDRYLMPSLQNKAMTAIMKKHTESGFTPIYQTKLIYANTLSGSPLRRFITDLVAYRCDVGSLMDSHGSQHWPHEALVDLLKVMGAKKMEEFGRFVLPETNKGRCYYHVHANGGNCDTKI
jgi:hypothetical protein